MKLARYRGALSALLILIPAVISATGNSAVPQTSFDSKSLVWYASYGSNLDCERFMCYIKGGTPRGALRSNPGCRDSSDPLESRRILIKGFELYFADDERAQRSWGGAPAFIRRNASSSVNGRMYLITYQQFNDVVLQENDFRKREELADRLPVSSNSIDKKRGFSLKEIKPDALYDQVLYVGDEGGHAIFTFTTTHTELPSGAPSGPYLQVILKGLKDTYADKTETAIYEYLSSAGGIQGLMTPEKLKRLTLQRAPAQATKTPGEEGRGCKCPSSASVRAP